MSRIIFERYEILFWSSKRSDVKIKKGQRKRIRQIAHPPVIFVYNLFPIVCYYCHSSFNIASQAVKYLYE